MLNNKKGFTLIEIVIVIVIIAILAAMLVPSLTSWIDKARLARIKSEADVVRNAVAAQVLVEVRDGADVAGITEQDVSDNFWVEISEEVNKDIQCTDSSADGYVTFTVSNGGIIAFTYSTDGHTATFDGTKWDYE